jgi:L-asparaginase/Glu-tRNA(Gln) amidotransferase subunit D
VPGNLGKAIKFARSPAGRKVMMEAIRVARSEEGKKLIAQARKVATTPEGKRLLQQAKEQAKLFAKAPGATADEVERTQAWQKVRERFNNGDKRP